MKSKFLAIIKNQSGATAVEYGLIAALISVVIVVAVTTAGRELKTTYSRVGSHVTKANS